MKRFSPLFIILFLLSFSAYSQTDDFGIWYGAGGSLDITGSLDFKLEGDIRTINNASKIDEGFGEAGLSLQIFRFLSVSSSYRLTSELEDDGNYYLRHKFFADMTGKKNLGRFGISGRLKYQRQVKTYIKDANDETPDNHLRLKLETSYNIPKSKFEPCIYYETFARIFEASEKTFDEFRLSAGASYKIAKKQKITVSYIYKRDYLPHRSDMNIISLFYDFKI